MLTATFIHLTFNQNRKNASCKTVDNYCKRLYNRNLNTKEVMT
jgi:hypothetical protein